MDIVVAQVQGRVPVTVFHIKGEINVGSADQLLADARKAYDAGTRNLLLDLREVPYITSAGLRTVHQIFQMLRGDEPKESADAVSKGLRDGTFKSPHLKLLNPTDNVLEVLKTSGFDMYLDIFHDFRSAVDSY